MHKLYFQAVISRYGFIFPRLINPRLPTWFKLGSWVMINLRKTNSFTELCKTSGTEGNAIPLVCNLKTNCISYLDIHYA